MRTPLPITSAANPRLKAAQRLREPAERRSSGLLLCEGVRAIGRALAAGLEGVELFHAPELTGVPTADLPHLVPELAHWPEAAGLYECPPGVLAKIAYLKEPEGLVAVLRQPAWSLDDCAQRVTASGKPALFLICAGIEKPGNLGAMARSVAAAGAHGLFVTGGPIDPFNPNVIRSSTGAIFALPALSVEPSQLRDWLKTQGIRVITATPEAHHSYSQAKLTGPVALVIGAEAQGVPDDWKAAAEQQVRIPMAAGCGIDSLNAAVTAALLLYEALRQRSE